MFHISDIKKFLRCERIFFYSKDESSLFRPYLRNDESINDLLIDYFDIDNCFTGVTNDSSSRFFDNVDKYEWFFHPRFIDGQLRINIPYMHKTDKGFDIYFMYYGSDVKSLDIITYDISLKVLNKLGIKTNKIFLISLNPNYINEGTLDPKQLFVVSDSFKGKKIKRIINESTYDYESILNEMSKYEFVENNAKKCKYCRQNGLCDYYDRCFPDEEKIEDDSILTLVSSKDKNAMFDEGIKKLKDVDINRLEGNRVQYAQIMASKNGGLFVDKIAIRKWLETINIRPLSFVDFEWDRYLIPPFRLMKPMDVVCFEYALYTLDQDGHLNHKTFVGKKDCREEFVISLIDNMPKSGPILAYNADGAEILRLKELAEMFPKYKDDLEQICSRFIDLAMPFIDGLIYDVRMKGNYTLKKLVDICSDYSYKDLDIYDGMEAVYNWRNIDKGNVEDDSKIVSDLKQYCSLDAYGLFLVYKWLVEAAI